MTKKTAIEIQLNGRPKKLPAGLTAGDLLRRLSLKKEMAVIELNLKILNKKAVEKTALKNGDCLEIVHFIGGGQAEDPPKKATRKKKVSPAAAQAQGVLGGKSLVIVESPAKCKTIGKYLGQKFEIAASMGHIMDLPKSEMGIKIEMDFEPVYVVTTDRRKTVSELKKKARDKDNLYLACDPDREGEAISWHLRNLLGKDKKCYRVVFNEITKEAVRQAFDRPGEIDMNLVSAQQARRVLDRLVGYSLSPLLWQKVGRGLSAGRVQSVALRLIVDQERKIQAFVPQEYWSIEALLKKHNEAHEPFLARLEQIAGQKIELKEGAVAHAHAERIRGASFAVKEVKQQKKKRHPYPPYNTSKLQQAGYNVLRFPAAKTMKIAQQLYEGVDIGEEGSVGLITYMRTDSVRLSDVALKETRDYILNNYGQEYLPISPNIYKTSKSAQDAHEAVRPSSILRQPEEIEKYLTPDQAKLYGLIWRQTVASQMTPAVVAQQSVEIAAGEYLFKATGSRMEFLGFLKVSGREEDRDNLLPDLEIGQVLDLMDLKPEQHFTKPPPRFTDATLVKALEEKGIGRPSTYAPIIATLVERTYIRREGGALIPSELGILVTDLLVRYFSRLLDYEFTATMEEGLDKIEEGQAQWVSVVRDFYHIFNSQMEIARTQMQNVKKESQATDQICDKCQKPMVIKWGRRGRFLSCSGWPQCRNAKSISTDVDCPQCKTGKLVERRARSGRGRKFYGCTRYPECTFIINRLPSSTNTEPENPAEPPPPESANG